MITPEALDELGFTGSGVIFIFPDPMNEFTIQRRLAVWIIKKNRDEIKTVTSLYEVENFYNKVVGRPIKEKE